MKLLMGPKLRPGNLKTFAATAGVHEAFSNGRGEFAMHCCDRAVWGEVHCAVPHRARRTGQFFAHTNDRPNPRPLCGPGQSIGIRAANHNGVAE